MQKHHTFIEREMKTKLYFQQTEIAFLTLTEFL